MAKVSFKGWNDGLKKISLTTLFQQKANLPLDVAKARPTLYLTVKPLSLKAKLLSYLKN